MKARRFSAPVSGSVCALVRCSSSSRSFDIATTSTANSSVCANTNRLNAPSTPGCIGSMPNGNGSHAHQRNSRRKEQRQRRADEDHRPSRGQRLARGRARIPAPTGPAGSRPGLEDTTMRSGRFSRKPGTRQTASHIAGIAQHRRPHRTLPLEGARALPEADEGHDEERIADADGEISSGPLRAA